MLRETHVSSLQPLSARPAAARTILQLPVAELWAQCREQVGGTREHVIIPGASWAVALRVDWDGVSPDHGTFEVHMGSDVWKTLPHPEPSRDDVISLENELENSVLLACFERGPENPSTPFQVRALPVQWLMCAQELTVLLQDMSFVAVRGRHYTYPSDLDIGAIPWQGSYLIGGTQQAELDLPVGPDYELWVRLQSPLDSDKWRLQDPIIKTGSGGGNTGGYCGD